MSIVFGNIYQGGALTLGLLTADNGLTATGSNVELGGTLIKNTTITPAAFTLLLGVLGLTASAAQSSAAPVNANDLVRLSDLPIVSKVKGSVNATSPAYLDYNSPLLAAAMYRLSYAVVCDTIAGGNMVLQLSYIDENGNAQNHAIATINALGASQAAPFNIYVGSLAAVLVDLVVTGTISCHVAMTLELLV